MKFLKNLQFLMIFNFLFFCLFVSGIRSIKERKASAPKRLKQRENDGKPEPIEN